MILFYFDHNVHSAIANGLGQRGFDVLTAVKDGRSVADDADLLSRATELGRIVVTFDDDFLALADEWLASNRSFAGVIYGHQLRVTVGQAIRDLTLISEAMTPDEFRDRVLFLPL